MTGVADAISLRFPQRHEGFEVLDYIPRYAFIKNRYLFAFGYKSSKNVLFIGLGCWATNGVQKNLFFPPQ